MYFCSCKGLTLTQLQSVSQSGAATAESLIEVLGLQDDECCGRCAGDCDRLLALAHP